MKLLKITVPLILLFTAVGCQQADLTEEVAQGGETAEERLQNQLKEYPGLKYADVIEIPEELSAELIVPSVEALPFDLEQVSVITDNEPPYFRTTLEYDGKKHRGLKINIAVRDPEELTFKNKELVELENGVDAYYEENNFSDIVEWTKDWEGQKLHYFISLFSIDPEKSFSKDEVVKLVNTIIEAE